MKIYTKTGDKGETSLVGGSRVPKCCSRVEAYGDVDELISWLGLIIAATPDEFGNEKDNLLAIQKELMAVSSHFACNSSESRLKGLDSDAVLFLEGEIDRMSDAIPAQTAFILPGAPRFSAAAHVARTVCRRAERHALRILQEECEGSDGNLENIRTGIKYLNRLSDYLFALGRYFTNKSGSADINWLP